MLGPEHVRVRRRGDELTLPPLDGKRRARVEALAAELLRLAEGRLGERRSALEQALAAVECRPSERRLVQGLAKLLLDACQVQAPGGVDAAALRREVFERAARARRGEGEMDRRAVLAAAGAGFGLGPDEVEEALFADLPGEARVLRLPALGPAQLAEQYERAARQAILLRAVRVTADVVCRSPAAYRALFGKLKFRRLLHRIERAERGYRIVIDGPHSLFASVTKYGLALALVLPALEAVDELRLTAELRWGPRREPLVFRHEARGSGPGHDLTLSKDAQALLDAFASLSTPWRAAPAERLFDVPGLGVCVPDLTFTHAQTGRVAHLEILGYWSRDAAFRRAELARAGLPEPILFALSSRLRVSEEILDASTAAALYVYKGVMSARAVERRLDQLVDRLCTPPSVV